MKNAFKNAVSLKRYNSKTVPLREVVPKQKMLSYNVATTHLDMAESFWDTLYLSPYNYRGIYIKPGSSFSAYLVLFCVYFVFVNGRATVLQK